MKRSVLSHLWKRVYDAVEERSDSWIRSFFFPDLFIMLLIHRPRPVDGLSGRS
jgi:hypothetical protein